MDTLVPVVAIDVRWALQSLETVYGDAQAPDGVGKQIREGALFKRKNAVHIRTLPGAKGVYLAPRRVCSAASGTVVYTFATHLAAAGAAADGGGVRLPNAPSKVVKAYLFCPSGPALEDWYTALYLASQLPLDALSGLRLPPLPSLLSSPPSQSHRQTSADSADGGAAAQTGDDPACAALNTLVSRLYRSLAPTAATEAGLIEKMMRKIALARLPSMLTEVQVRSVNLGSSPPQVSHLRLVSADERRALEAPLFKGSGASSEQEDEDAACVEMRVEFDGQMHMSASAQLVLSQGFSLGSFTMSNKNKSSLEESLERDHKAQSKLEKDNKDDTDKRDKKGDSKEKDGKRTGRYEVDLNMDIEFTRIVGTLRVLVKPPPSDRVWFGFVQSPELGLKVTPIVSSRQVGWQYVLDLIDSKIREAVRSIIAVMRFRSFYLWRTFSWFHSVAFFSLERSPKPSTKKESIKRRKEECSFFAYIHILTHYTLGCNNR